MTKNLVNNEAEYVKLFESFDLVDAEEFLEVIFAYSDGQFPPKPGESCDGIDDSLDLDRTKYRKKTYSNFPEEYPCVVLLENTSSFDRTGNVKFQMLEFIYLSDFEQ